VCICVCVSVCVYLCVWSYRGRTERKRGPVKKPGEPGYDPYDFNGYGDVEDDEAGRTIHILTYIQNVSINLIFNI